MLRKLVINLIAILLFLLTIKPVLASEITLHLFYSTGCPHCAKEKMFLGNLKDKYPDLVVKEYEVTGSYTNLELYKKVGEELQVNISSVPFTVIGDKYVSGYLNDETSGSQIESLVLNAINEGSINLVDELSIEKPVETVVPKAGGVLEENGLNGNAVIVAVPVFGELDIKKMSLPVFTFVIALLDGFNPCAMWTLLFLISLLLGMEDRRRMWILGVTFILASAIIYFLFLSAWLNLFLFLGYVVWIRIFIGIIALIAGIYYLKDYFTNKKGGCTVIGDEKRRKIFAKIKSITKNENLVWALIGIIVLAVAVNMVELICSAGLPAVYTNILSLSKLATWQYYLYLVFYVVIFMLDDLFVFVTAMITLQAIGIQSKYSRWSHLVGGVLMLVIALLLFFKSEWLMFG